MLRKTVILILILAAVGCGYWIYRSYTAPRPVVFRTAEVHEGELMPTIGATGTIEPEEVVDIGAQVQGVILAFGKDAAGNVVDYQSPVDNGTVLARIDDTLPIADRNNARAMLDSARVGVEKAQADVNQAMANAHKAQRDWSRAQTLHPTSAPSDAISESDYDTYQSGFETTSAGVEVAKAALAQAKAAVEQAQAGLDKAQKNVDYCTITSPVKGIIIDRRMTIGQTVVSSLNAPSLFLVAKDLTKVQIWVPVNEADIGSIAPGQDVTFTVDAFAGRTFTGKVGKIRLNAQMTQNVVTYTVEVETDNSDGRLFPYMTASVTFEVAHLKDVLLVPNEALRYEPRPELIAADVQPTGRGKHGGPGEADNSGGKAVEGAPAGSATTLPPTTHAADSAATAPSTQPAEPGHRHHRPTTSPSTQPTMQPGSLVSLPVMRSRVWVLDPDGRHVRRISIKTGPTDGIVTEVLGTKLPAGTVVLVGELHSDAPVAAGGAASPFIPQLPKGMRPGR